ncbi:MAG: RcpC/CpaB family pilus assembly protein [Microthrixaceae bacterium]
MSSRRVIVLVGSLVVALVAAVLTFGFLNGVKEDSEAEGQLVQVLVVKRAIAAGTSADEALASQAIGEAKRRRVDLPPDFLSQPADISVQEPATINLEPNEIVTCPLFDTNLSVSNAPRIDPGNVAVAISSDQVRSVAALVQPGDFVNLMAIGTPPTQPVADGEEAAAPRDRWRRRVRHPVLQPAHRRLPEEVKVLSIGDNLGTAVARLPPRARRLRRRSRSTPASSWQVPAEASFKLVIAAERSGACTRPSFAPTTSRFPCRWCRAR